MYNNIDWYHLRAPQRTWQACSVGAPCPPAKKSKLIYTLFNVEHNSSTRKFWKSTWQNRTWNITHGHAIYVEQQIWSAMFWESTRQNRTWNIKHGHAIYAEQQIWSTMFWESTRWMQTYIVVDEMSPESSVAGAPPACCDPSLLVHLVKCVMGQPKQWFTFHLTMKSFWIIMFVNRDKHQMLFPSAIVVFDLIW